MSTLLESSFFEESIPCGVTQIHLQQCKDKNELLHVSTWDGKLHTFKVVQDSKTPKRTLVKLTTCPLNAEENPILAFAFKNEDELVYSSEDSEN